MWDCCVGVYGTFLTIPTVDSYGTGVFFVPARTLIAVKLKVCLFLCRKLYSILRTFIPGPKNLFANKLFSFFAATMTWSGFGPYHGMWREYAQTKCIGAILTPWAMSIALGLGVIMPQPELYHAYS